MQTLYLIVPLAPLLGALIAGLLGPVVGRRGAHSVTIALMVISFGAALAVLRDVLEGYSFNGVVYTWLVSGDVRFDIGFLIDRLSATMMVVVTFVSLAVHVYTIGYMADDPGYQRFFSYISLFTFSMLMLVMANNFLQLFFGWEAVGLVSYLLIGFWYTRPSAIYANLKAFLVNRVGDFGFLLGIALVYLYTSSLNYGDAFAAAGKLAKLGFPGMDWRVITVICILLFIGAMGKSAQFPLHVWLPDSMEGPTPISALIHAATMVTAGIFMVARMSPLFEHSTTALTFVIVIGAITALFMALVAIVQNDIKRVVAYSTLSQLGYMTVALGASAYSAAIFHLATHAFFKAVLFLGAGSVIIALHHQQDMRYMGGLKRYMPITYWTMLIAALSSAGIPGLAGFFSKDAIIEVTGLATTPGSSFAYFCVAACVFVTALYTFRMVFMTFHGPERFRAAPGHDDHAKPHDGHADEHAHAVEPHESPLVVTLPLIALSIPAVCAGWLIGPVLFGGFFGDSIHIAPEHQGLAKMAEEFHGVLAMMWHAVFTLPFWLSVAGIATAWFLYIKRPDLPGVIAQRFALIYRILDRKYGFDEFNDWFFAGGLRRLGRTLWQFGDVRLIDGFLVNGSAHMVGRFAGVIRHLQSGYIYHYAFTMIIGVLVLVTLLIIGEKGNGSGSVYAMLSTVIWLPIFAGIAVLLTGSDRNAGLARLLALVGAIAGFVVALPLWTGFDRAMSGFQFVERHAWIESFNVFYHVGIDGISLLLILLNCLTTVLVVIAGWRVIDTRVAQYMAAFLILSGLMNGVFCALDALLFYVFFEATLIPMFIVIGVWGGPNRVYAAVKFILYTLFGSLLALVALIYLYIASAGSFSLQDWYALPLPLGTQILVFLAFFVAFAVKVPMVPVHTWLPDAHVEAPTGGSVVLAAIMLKLGGYGFLRLSLPIAPDASHALDGWMIALSLIAVIYIGLVALVQSDMKKLIAYSSISHMGFVTLGIFMFNTIGVEGAVIQMVSHGFVSGALFLCVGVLYDRMHSRQISDYGGVVNRMPVFASFFMLFAMANSGLPGTSGFVGEFMVVLSAVKVNFWYAAAAGATLILGAAYTLWMYKRVVFGPVANDHVAALQDLSGREVVFMTVLAVCVLAMGVYPAPFTDVLHTSVSDLLVHVAKSKLP